MAQGKSRRIVLRHVSKVLGRGKHRQYVLRDVNTVFDADEHYVVLGPRRSGKSTLIRILGGSVRVGRGKVEWNCRVVHVREDPAE